MENSGNVGISQRARAEAAESALVELRSKIAALADEWERVSARFIASDTLTANRAAADAKSLRNLLVSE